MPRTFAISTTESTPRCLTWPLRQIIALSLSTLVLASAFTPIAMAKKQAAVEEFSMVIHTQESGVIPQQRSYVSSIDGLKTAKLPQPTAVNTAHGSPDILDILRGGSTETTEEYASTPKVEAVETKKPGRRKWFRMPEIAVAGNTAKTEIEAPDKPAAKIETKAEGKSTASVEGKTPDSPAYHETLLLDPMRSVAASVKDKWIHFLSKKGSPATVPNRQTTAVAYASPAVALSSNPVRNADSDVLVEPTPAQSASAATGNSDSEGEETVSRASAVTAPEAEPIASNDATEPTEEVAPRSSGRRLLAQSERRMAQAAPSVKLMAPHEEPRRAIVPRTESEYTLKVGDVLLVNDRSFTELGTPPTSDSMPILPDGTAYIYPVGVVQAAGMNLRELNELVDREARKFVKHPSITISVSSIQQVGVYVRGEVAQPGYYFADATAATVAAGKGSGGGGSSNTGMTVTRALQLAGGLTTDADFNQVVVFDYAGKPVASVDLWRVIVNGDTKQDIILQSGDSILVPRGIPRPEALESLGLLAADKLRVQIWGAVKSPGLYELKAKDSIISALSVAGGPTVAAGDKVTLARQNANGTITRRTFKLSDAIGNPTSPGRFNVREGDLVLINESVGKKVANKVGVAILTFVGAAGLIVISKAIPQAQSRTQNNATSNTNNNNSSIVSFP